MVSELTPAQHQMLRQLKQNTLTGVPTDRLHASTLAGLTRRGLVRISFGRAYAWNHPDTDGPDAA